jgi:hypothetical protein
MKLRERKHPLVSDENEDSEEDVRDINPPRKRARKNKKTPSDPTKQKGKSARPKGRLRGLPDLPVDLLYEVLNIHEMLNPRC